MILQIKNVQLLDYYIHYLKQLIEKFVIKTDNEYSVEDTVNFLYRKLTDPDTLILIKLDKNYIPKGYAIIIVGYNMCNKKIAHFWQVAHSNGKIDWQEMLQKTLEILKPYGIEKISFSTKRNIKAFKRLFKLNGYQEYTLFEKEVN